MRGTRHDPASPFAAWSPRHHRGTLRKWLRQGSEHAGVGVERRLPAEMRVQDGRVAADLTGADEVDEARHRLSLVDGIDDHCLETAGEADSLDRRLDGDAVAVACPALEHGYFVVTQVSAEVDERGGVAGDPGDLIACLVHGGRGVDAEHP